MMDRESNMVLVCRAFLNLMIENKLEKALKLNIPVKSIIDRAWNFKFTDEENTLYKELSNKKENRVEEVV